MTPKDLSRYFFAGVRYLNRVAVVAGLWAFFYPLPYRLVIVLCALIFGYSIAAYVYSKGAIALEEPKKSRAVHVSTAVAISSLALAWRAFFDFHFVNSRDLVIPLGIVFFCLAVLLYLKTRDFKKKARVYLTIFPFLFAFSFGAVTEINGLAYSPGPVEYKARVISKQISSGSDGPDLYYLLVTPWGDREVKNKLVVSKRTYAGFNADDEVRILVKQGAMNIPYYVVIRKR